MSSTERVEPLAAVVERPHPIRQVVGWLGGLGLLVAVSGAIAVGLVPVVTGAQALTVLSGSMEPALPVGSILVVRAQPVDQIRLGDVITFTDRDPTTSATRTVTHRVVSVEQGPGGPIFRTKGDANNSPDLHPAAAADVQGVLWYSVPMAGWLRMLLVSPAGLLCLTGVVLLMVAGHLLLPKTRPAGGLPRAG